MMNCTRKVNLCQRNRKWQFKICSKCLNARLVQISNTCLKSRLKIWILDRFVQRTVQARKCVRNLGTGKFIFSTSPDFSSSSNIWTGNRPGKLLQSLDSTIELIWLNRPRYLFIFMFPVQQDWREREQHSPPLRVPQSQAGQHVGQLHQVELHQIRGGQIWSACCQIRTPWRSHSPRREWNQETLLNNKK